jgi:hypothetical protein
MILSGQFFPSRGPQTELKQTLKIGCPKLSCKRLQQKNPSSQRGYQQLEQQVETLQEGKHQQKRAAKSFTKQGGEAT